MTGPATTANTGRAIQWSRRQREVLDLLAKGHTNGQIATDLGISLDGAKWHVREVITKLDVDSRDEAAEWWRQQHGLRARLNIFTRTGMARMFAPGMFRWVGVGGLAVAGAGAVAIAIVVITGDPGDSPSTAADPTPPPDTATTGPALTAAPTGTPAPGDGSDASPTAQPSDSINGTTVQHAQPGPAVGLDGQAVIIATGCWQCDGPTSSLVRLFESADGELVRDTLFTAPGGAERYISGYDIAPDMSRMLVTVCSSGYCGGVADPTDDASTTAYESTDGGLTWDNLGEVDAGPQLVVSLAYAPDGGFVLERTFAGQDDAGGLPWRHELLRWPSRDAIAEWLRGQPAPVLVEDGTLLSIDDARQRLIDTDGGVYFDLNDEGLAIGGVTNPHGVDGLLLSLNPAGDARTPFFQALLRDGELEWILETTPASETEGIQIYIHNLLGESALLANDVTPGDDYASRPAFVDIADGSLHHLDGPFEGIADANQDDVIGGRNYLIAARSGPFHRVDTGGSCLNVREEPDTGSEIIRCYVDGVLLAERADTDAPDGWLAVHTPDGYASTEFLIR